MVSVKEGMMSKANMLALILKQRPDYHISERVQRHNHWTLCFTRDNIPPKAAAMCIIGHIIDDLAVYSLDECLLLLPMMHSFHIIAGDLGGFEGCYVYYNRKKNKWLRSDKTFGEGKEACFVGRGKKYE